ncbi:type IV pilin protein [Pseudoxanthomonas winnipegensis]|uniref:Type IV pilin protein n=1 Tax=Pseudoxanthomonas winnipegensis TaxID=2480810 RepID=A0A4V2HGB3_9GAMM|nr:type IV pilin protein [Pseudoxanthomonas winnipegensis]TAA45628.1 type IV pilin protein [Pseudoxanthomonas winnipegensis]
MSSRGNRLASGFTLIELMIVVAVVAILASIAYPSYQEYVRKARRAQAKADLLEYAQLAERFHTVNNTYVNFTLPTKQSPREGGTAYYKLDLSNQAQATFLITATAQGPQASDSCGNLSINQAGVKKNTAGTLASCW